MGKKEIGRETLEAALAGICRDCALEFVEDLAAFRLVHAEPGSPGSVWRTLSVETAARVKAPAVLASDLRYHHERMLGAVGGPAPRVGRQNRWPFTADTPLEGRIDPKCAPAMLDNARLSNHVMACWGCASLNFSSPGAMLSAVRIGRSG